MAIIGMIISTVIFVIFFVFVGLMINSGLLSLIMAVAAIIGLALALTGYNKSYKISKKGMQTQKDKFKMAVSLYLTIAILIYALNTIFELELTLYLIYALPYFLAVILLLILTGAVVTLIKISAAKKAALSISRFCRSCGYAVDDSMKFCVKCGARTITDYSEHV